MFDLYEALVPAVSIITFLNLLSLKLALRDNTVLAKIYQKKHTINLSIQQNQEESAIKTILKFMFLHFTPVQFFAVRRARYKLAFFFAISITILGTYFIKTPFVFAGTGTAVYLLYFMITMATFKSESEEEKQEQSKIYRQKYLQIIFAIISLALNLAVVGLVFKNYTNSLLSSFITNACINIALDNCVVRPIVVTLIGLPLSRSATVMAYVAQCNKQLNLLQLYEQVGQKQMLSNPGKMLNPSKIFPKIPLQLQIQPVPITNDKQNEGQKAMDILKRIKRDRHLNPINPQRNIQCELTLNSLFNSNKKQHDFQAQEPIQEQNLEAKPQCQDFQLKIKKKFCSQNLIMVNPSQQQQVQNQQDIPNEQEIKDKLNKQSQVSARNFETFEANNKQTLNNQQEQNEPVKISLHSSSQPTSRQQPLRICLNGQINLDCQENYHDEEDIQTDNYRKRRELHTIDQNTRNTYGVLRIKEENHHHHISQIEQIDLNSPERKKRQLHVQLEDQSKLGIVKRKKKKFSHDNTQNRVIKFSTGEPYLQYLPHMLAKDNKSKKSQNISKKEVIIDSRATNSVKRPKKRLIGLQNNQNLVPEFRIQEL